jgi:hypothetical protein
MAIGRDASALRRGRVATASALALAALALSVWAAPSGAVVAQIGGHAYGFTPIRGVNVAALPSVQRALRASGRSASGPQPYDKTGQLNYHGGPVMHSVTTHVVYWDPSGEFTATTKSIVKKFFTDLAADSGLATNVMGIAGQYGDGTGHALYSSTFESEGTDATSYPASGCSVPSGDPGPPYTHCLTDTQLKTELSGYIVAHTLPKGPAQQYILLLPHRVVTCFTGSSECSNNVFCAYHSSIEGGTSHEIIYSDIPFSLLDSGNVKGCQFDGNGEVQNPNGDTAGTDGSTRATSTRRPPPTRSGMPGGKPPTARRTATSATSSGLGLGPAKTRTRFCRRWAAVPEQARYMTSPSTATTSTSRASGTTSAKPASCSQRLSAPPRSRPRRPRDS